MFQREGLQMMSTSRKTQRGGGVAIVADTLAMDMEEPEVLVPHNLEIKWAIGRPKAGHIKAIIIGAFYYPPRSMKKQKLLNHITETIHLLLTKHPQAEVLLGGDRNEMEMAQVISHNPGLRYVPTPPPMD